MTKDPTSDSELQRLAMRVGALLIDSERRIVTAESCTGGWIAKVMTDIPGSSSWFLGGVVAYSNTLKQSLLGVLPSTLVAHGAVSEAAAREMAIGALETLGGQFAIAVTGIAGPDGGSPAKPVGLTYVAVADAVGVAVRRHVWNGDRSDNKRRSAEAALDLLLERIDAADASSEAATESG